MRQTIAVGVLSTCLLGLAQTGRVPGEGLVAALLRRREDGEFRGRELGIPEPPLVQPTPDLLRRRERDAGHLPPVVDGVRDQIGGRVAVAVHPDRMGCNPSVINQGVPPCPPS